MASKTLVGFGRVPGCVVLDKSRQLVLALGLCTVALPQTVPAVVIGFDAVPFALFTGPLVEDGFVLELLADGSGALFGNDQFGNPNGHMEGSAQVAGGTLRIRWEHGGEFTFEAADVSNWTGIGGGTGPSRPIDFLGYLAGVQKGVDTLYTLADQPGSGDVYVTRSSANLAGVMIDELRIVLDAGAVQQWAEEVDNIVLGVDAPTPLALVAVGLAGIGYQRRKVASASPR